VLHEIKRKQISQIEAAQRLKISDRHIHRLLVGLRKLGDRAVLHGLRGRPSNRRLAMGFQEQILTRVQQRYAGAKKIKAPTLSTTGKYDQIVPPLYSQELADSIPTAKRTTIPSGHLSFLEKPVDLASAMLTFLLEKHPHQLGT
jgi:pimeloyl-ACP methyl ester carboxylesterase